MPSVTADKNGVNRIKPEHKALGEYYFHGKSLEESATLSGLEVGVLEGLVKDLNKRSLLALKDFYEQDLNLGIAADNYKLNRNELLGVMGRYGFNGSSEDEESREKVIDLLAKNQSLPL